MWYYLSEPAILLSRIGQTELVDLTSQGRVLKERGITVLLCRYQEFCDGGERDVLLEEITGLRGQVDTSA